MSEPHSLTTYYATQLKQLPLYTKWAELIAQEAPKFFPIEKRVHSACTGCGRRHCELAFIKNGFTYKHCNSCGSLFVSPRPTEAMLRSFYRHSRAMKFWKREIMLSTLTIRKNFQISPLTHWLESIINRHFGNASIHAIDYTPSITTVWDTKKLMTRSTHLTLAEPLLFEKTTSVHAKGSLRIANTMQSISGTADIITAFGVLERVYNPQDILTTIAKKCRKNGLLLMTTNTMSGFEYQLLGGHSHRIVPPYRLNLLTIEALQKLLTKAGFKIINCSTPGKLDAEIVASTVAQNPAIVVPEFFKYLFRRRDHTTLKSFQDFLQLSNLSSHLRIVARKM